MSKPQKMPIGQPQESPPKEARDTFIRSMADIYEKAIGEQPLLPHLMDRSYNKYDATPGEFFNIYTGHFFEFVNIFLIRLDEVVPDNMSLYGAIRSALEFRRKHAVEPVEMVPCSKIGTPTINVTVKTPPKK